MKSVPVNLVGKGFYSQYFLVPKKNWVQIFAGSQDFEHFVLSVVQNGNPSSNNSLSGCLFGLSPSSFRIIIFIFPCTLHTEFSYIFWWTGTTTNIVSYPLASPPSMDGYQRSLVCHSPSSLDQNNYLSLTRWLAPERLLISWGTDSNQYGPFTGYK